MNLEKHLISSFADLLPRSERQVNGLFESDSEILRTNRGYLLFSVDDYSDEDHFRTNNPFNLGWNLAVATISDIFASGGVVSYFAHSVSVNNLEWDENYLNQFTKGIASVLDKTGAYFLGGDFGFSKNWHYTGIALGKSIRALTRIGTSEGDIIFMTGTVGAGNMEAALRIFNPDNGNIPIQFIPRHREAKLIAKYAGCCIDTSDGTAVSLKIIAELNNIGFEITDTNYDLHSYRFAERMNIPKELLLLGECGEYELLFTIAKEKAAMFREEAKQENLHFKAIGEITSAEKKVINTPEVFIDLSEFNIRGRGFSSEKDYIKELTKYIEYHGTN